MSMSALDELRASLKAAGADVDALDGLALARGRSVTLHDLLAAGLTPRVVTVGKRPAVTRAAGRALLDGTATPGDVWWALAGGWHESGKRVLVHTGEGPAHSRAPTPERDLERLLLALVALRPLTLKSREEPAASWERIEDVTVATMARQAVRRLRNDAPAWARAWVTQGRTTAQAADFVRWLDTHAVPWNRARPEGQDPVAWATDAAAFEAAGYSPQSAAEVARLPRDDPGRPSQEQLDAMAALRGA